MKESGKDRLKCVVYESTLSTADAVPPSPMGKATKREYRFSRIVKANIRICEEKQYRRTKPSPRGKAKRRRLRRKKEANPASLRSAAPSKGRGSCGHSLLPMEGGAPKGRRLDGDAAIPETQPSPRGEGGERSEPDRVLAV